MTVTVYDLKITLITNCMCCCCRCEVANNEGTFLGT